VLPVGCGKSGCITLTPFAFKATRTLVIAPGVPIAGQLRKDFDPSRPDMFYIKCGILDGQPYPGPVEIRGTTTNRADLEEADVVVTNIHQLQGTANRWLQDLPADFFDLIQFDEGHHNVLFNAAMRWELIPYQHNPMSLVRVKGSSKRLREPKFLTAQEFRALLEHIPEPFRTMCTVAMCLGLRVSEVLGLKWTDIDWEGMRIAIRQAYVYGRQGDVKTRTSQKWMPLDRSLAEKLNQHRFRFASRPNIENWVFANPATGKPYWPGRVQENWLVPAAMKVGIGRIGWHTFRHSHSTLLHALGVDLKVQQELLRHADIRTTMNIYTQAVPSALREANSKVVRLVIPAQVA
jgi:integrase